jgi:plastocyanin
MMKMKFVRWTMATVLVTGAVAFAEDNGSISGKISFAGDAPKPKKIKMDADPQCAAMHTDAPATSEEVLVNNGMLKNVFVYLKSGVTGTYPKPSTPVMINQKGCHYEPHVFGMQAGQMLVIKNSDDTLHNIHALPNNNEEFNKGQPSGSADLKKTFTKADVMVKFKCDVHPWMTAYVGVLEHPFFSVSGDDGSFSIKGLPAGDYEVAAWHEKYGTQTAKIKVGAGEAKSQDFKFSKPAE